VQEKMILSRTDFGKALSPKTILWLITFNGGSHYLGAQPRLL